MARSRVVQRDRGARALLKAIRDVKAGLKVGVVGSEAASPHAGAEGLTVAQVAEIHEYGLGVPERSFVRATLDAQAPQLVSEIHKGALAVARGKTTPLAVLHALGLRMVGLMQEAIAEGIPPALSEAYLQRKLAKYPGATTPLIASGQMRQAITYKIDPQASERGK